MLSACVADPWGSLASTWYAKLSGRVSVIRISCLIRTSIDDRNYGIKQANNKKKISKAATAALLAAAAAAAAVVVVVVVAAAAGSC